VTGGAFQTPLALWRSVPKVHGRFSPSSGGAGRSCFLAADSGVAAQPESGGNGTPLDCAELERCGVRSMQGWALKVILIGSCMEQSRFTDQHCG
jgi:hypothetical protein